MKKENIFIIVSQLIILTLFFQNLISKAIFMFVVIVAGLLSITYFSAYFKKIDGVNRIFLAYAIAFILSLIVRWKFDNETIKILLNGFVWIFLAYYGYVFGKTISNNSTGANKLVLFLINLFMLLGLLNIYAWFTTTGGVIARYNFISPITQTTSAGIVFCSLGFFLSLVYFDSKTLISWIRIIVFLINIVIIVTRLEQAMFCLYSVYYFLLLFLLYKNIGHRLKLIFICAFVCMLIIILAPNILGLLSPYYNGLFLTDGADIIPRQIAIQAAIGSFKENPIVGIGYGMFGLQMSNSTLASAHNGFFSILAEWGIIGLIITFILLINVLIKSFKVLFQKEMLSKLDIVFAIFLQGMVLSFFISNFVLMPPPSERSYYAFGFIIWIFFGLIKARSSGVRMRFNL